MYKKGIVCVFFFLFWVNPEIQAQCSMCKAVVESSVENGGAIGAGLNKGILYLMAFPYLLLLLFALAWLFSVKKEKPGV